MFVWDHAGNTDLVCANKMLDVLIVLEVYSMLRLRRQLHSVIHMHDCNKGVNNVDMTMVKRSQSFHWERDSNGDFNEEKQGTVCKYHCELITESCFICVFYRPWGLPTAHMEVLLWVISFMLYASKPCFDGIDLTLAFFVIL